MPRFLFPSTLHSTENERLSFRLPMKKNAAAPRNSRAALAAEALAQAVAAGNRGDLGEAERIASDVIARNPQHAEALQLLGALLMAQHRPRDAIAPLEAAARLGANPEVETHLAIALRDIGRGDDAVTWLFRAIDRPPAFPRAFKELGELLRAKRRYAEAVGVLQRGIDAAPTVPELSLLLGGLRPRARDCAWQRRCVDGLRRRASI
jgi:tetratricopeptide (TPR) repeat protein